MNKPLIAAVVLVLLAGVSWAGYDRFGPVPKAKRAVMDVLTDPESARFKNVRYVSDAKIVCGQVNSKNRMGGYIGFIPFTVEAGEVFIDDGEGPADPGKISDAEERRLDPLQFEVRYREHQKKVVVYEAYLAQLAKIESVCDDKA